MVIILAIGCAGPRAVEPVALHQDRPTAVPLRTGGPYSLVRTHIDGRDAGMFLVDTGSNLTVVASGVASRLELPTVGEGQTHGIAGSDKFNRHTFESVSMAGFRLHPRALVSLNVSRLQRSGVRWAGIIGFDALADEVFTLDQQAGVLTVGDTFNTQAHTERLLLYSGLPTVRVKLGEHETFMILDTGADNELTLHQDVARRWPGIFRVTTTGPGRSRGVGGTVSGALSWVDRLTLWGVTLRDVPVSVDPRPAGIADPRIAGRIGNGLLRHYRLTFDAPRGRIAAQWLPITGADQQPDAAPGR